MQINEELEARKACTTGICSIREDIYSSAFLEIIRQVSIACKERGLLLLKVKTELDNTISAYKRLYKSVRDCAARADTKRTTHTKEAAPIQESESLPSPRRYIIGADSN